MTQTKQKLAHDEFRYIVSICGGRGPDVWDNEIEIIAHDITEAILLTKKRLNEDRHMPSDWWITGVNQDD